MSAARDALGEAENLLNRLCHQIAATGDMLAEIDHEKLDTEGKRRFDIAVALLFTAEFMARDGAKLMDRAYTKALVV